MKLVRNSAAAERSVKIQRSEIDFYIYSDIMLTCSFEQDILKKIGKEISWEIL